MVELSDLQLAEFVFEVLVCNSYFFLDLEFVGASSFGSYFGFGSINL